MSQVNWAEMRTENGKPPGLHEPVEVEIVAVKL